MEPIEPQARDTTDAAETGATPKTAVTMLWRRIGDPGHDACRLEKRRDGWRLAGTAVFRHDRAAACLTYRVDCRPDWRSREAVVRGWLDGRTIDTHITRSGAGVWLLDGKEQELLGGGAGKATATTGTSRVPGAAVPLDLDFGFTPATNLCQLRRLALEVGQAADIEVAWLDLPGGTLDTLHQHYERRTAKSYWYEAPRFGYFGFLQVDAVGFIREYPGLWVAEV